MKKTNIYKQLFLLCATLFLQSCGETFEECLDSAAKNTQNEMATKIAVMQCMQEYPDGFKK